MRVCINKKYSYKDLEKNVVCKMVYITFVHSFLVYVRQKVFLHNYEFRESNNISFITLDTIDARFARDI